MDQSDLPFIACAVLVVVYAWERFNTPPSNRSSTRQALYWSSCVGYILTALTVFVALNFLLRVPAWRDMLFGKDDNASLPAPLIATLAMTTLLPTIPLLKRLDAWVLAAFLDFGAIPAEAKRRAATMLPRALTVTAADVVKLRDSYGGGDFGDTLATHLRESGADGLALSEYRFTRVVKLYDAMQSLRGNSRYERFFSDTSGELDELVQSVTEFIRRSDDSLTLAAQLQKFLENQADDSRGADAYEELMRDRREAFAQSCQEKFSELAGYLARAILRSEPNERGIVRKLRDLGFAAAEPMTEPEFPINSLTALALGIFVYLGVLTVFFSHLPDVSQTAAGGLVMAFRVAIARLAAISVMIWLMQRFSFFRRASGEPHKYFAYFVCGVITSAVAAAACVPFALSYATGFVSGMADGIAVVFLTGILCAVLAFCCDDWPEDSTPPRWLRPVEAMASGAVMAFGTSLIYYGGWMPPSMHDLHGWMVVAWIALPSAMAVMIGACVPHIYRTAHRAAAARRDMTSRAVAETQSAEAGFPARPIGVHG